MRPRPSFHPPLRLPAEDGFTLIELLVAVLVLTVGLLGLIGAFDSARKLNLLSERRTSMAHRAQLEIERLQALSYSELAMISEPSHEEVPHPNPTTKVEKEENEKFVQEHPDYYVNPSPITCTSLGAGCYAWNAESAGEQEALVKAATGKISAAPTGRKCSTEVGACEWEDGPVSGNVYDFITWHHDTNTACKNTENYKRLTVAVTAKVPSGNHQPAVIRVSTLIAKPNETKKEFEEC
jgi:prepilin-type N-terminal cleavage/methylation domain-containing protein